MFVTFNMKPTNAPWGGGNQWLSQFIDYLRKNGVKVNFQLSKETKCIFIVNYKSIIFKKFFFFKNKNHLTFNISDLEDFKKKYPNTPIIIRVNDSDSARKTKFIDKNFLRINRISSHNIYISKWIKNYYFKKKSVKKKEYSIIPISPDKKIFYFKKKLLFKKSNTIKVVAHHWSNDYYYKGFDRYLFFDNLLYKKRIHNIKFLIIGNVPNEISFKVANVLPPLYGKKLADKIRSADIYLSGSRNEAGGNHAVEGVSCGLPIIYYKNSGGVSENSKHYGVETNNKNILHSIEKIKKKYHLFTSRIKNKRYSSNDMNSHYLKIINNFLNK